MFPPPDTKDHRKNHLQLTAAGKQNFKCKINAIHKWHMSILSKLNKNDFKTFLNLLEKIADLAIVNIKRIKNV